MKNRERSLLILMMFIFSWFSTYSQWVLTRQDFPFPGDLFRQYDCDTNGVGLNPGPAGANVTWDYSMIQLEPGPYESQYATPIVGFYCFVIPMNLVENSNSFGSDFFYADSSTYSFLGHSQNLGFGLSKQLCFYDPLKEMKFPFTYGDTLADIGEGPYNYPGQTRYTTSFIYKECDGWGKLILPWATYDSALRVHVTAVHRDSMINVGLLDFDTYESYSWYVKSLRSPALSIYSSITTDSNNLVVSSYQGMVVDSVISVSSAIVTENNQPIINVHPNPFNDVLYIAGNGLEKAEVVIYDLAGRKLLQQKVANSSSITMSQFPRGVYFYKLYREGVVCKQGKLVKE